MLSFGRRIVSLVGNAGSKMNVSRNFHTTDFVRGFESFYDPVDTAASFTSGRAWTVPDLRRKVSLFKLSVYANF
jgi:hypothetical protein